ncbi:MAG: glycosyltransferase [Lachnospiraceae bacterium]
MKILFWQWNAFMQKGMENALRKMKIEYDVVYCIPKDWERDDTLKEAISAKLQTAEYDLLLSVNYAPVVSEVCEQFGVKYISWVYDSPLHIRDIHTFKNSCNRIFFFDRGQAMAYQKMGYEHMNHLPLAADDSVWKMDSKMMEKYRCDVALVGKLYQNDYNYLLSPLDQYYRGLLDGFVSTQECLYGAYILEDLIDDVLMEKLNAIYHKASKGTVHVKKEELAYACACEVTSRERFKALMLLSNRYHTNLYSNEKDERITKLHSMGYVDYYTQMPNAFRGARINLNISLKTIRTGIPLRVFDVLSCGGFLLTNYQEELPEWFEPGVDLVIYENMQDLVLKVDYYLKHEEERRQIAANGHRKVLELFNFQGQLERLLNSEGCEME